MEKLLGLLGSDKDAIYSSALTIAISLVVLFVLVKLIKLLFKKLHARVERHGVSYTALNALKYVLLAVVYIAAFSSIVSQIPSLSSFLSTLLAGSGIAALVVSVAAQEPIGNIVSGIIISITKPFRVGDLIRYIDKDISGYVESITLRHTVVRTFENKRLVIPNGMINSTAIENASIGDGGRVCLLLDFSITYESDARLAMATIASVIREHSDYLDVRTEEEKKAGAPEVAVRAVRFDDSAVVLRAWCWAKDTATSVSMRSDVLLETQRRFAEGNVEFAYPHMQLVVPGSADGN